MRTLQFEAFYGNDDPRVDKRVCILAAHVVGVSVNANARVCVHTTNGTFTLASAHSYDYVVNLIQSAK